MPGALRVLVLVLTLAAPTAAGAFVVPGLGDQKPDMFGDPRFLALNITHVRRSVSWDALDRRASAAELDRWMAAAHARGLSPLIGFDHSLARAQHKVLPSPRRFRREFRRFHARYPWVTDYATWNEANSCGQAICRRPDLAAAYYRAISSVCLHCVVLGAELLDVPGMISWYYRFRRFARVDPKFWGLHNYVGANRLSDKSTRQLLRATRGVIWLTETGGLVARRHHSRAGFPQSAAHAAVVTRYLFAHIAHLSRRIQRIYLYEWNAHTRHDIWDSALVSPTHQLRPAYFALADSLLKLGVRPRCALATSPPGCR